MASLQSPYLSNVTRVREVAAGGKPLALGETSAGVAQVQAALADLGYRFAQSAGQKMVMDGLYGSETVEVVKAFQRDRKLDATGIVEVHTLAAVDGMLSSQLAKPLSPKPRPGRVSHNGSVPAQPVGRRTPPIKAPDKYAIYFEDDYYMIGTEDPTVAPDAGAGPWKSKDVTYSVAAQWAVIQQGLMSGATNVLIGRNATKHVRHYFSNTD